MTWLAEAAILAAVATLLYWPLHLLLERWLSGG